MKYEGENFLLKLYRELYKEESVKHSGTKSDNKFKLIKKYLERLESTEKAFTREKEGAVNYLKNRYYDKYVIKEENIPESYYELQKKIALERGHGHVEYTDEMKKREVALLIDEQRKSLDVWLNYLMKENTSYPMWARYWAFQGMTKLGKYDKEKHRFTKRTKGTTMPFPELNAEALAHTIEAVTKYQEGENITDEKLESLVDSGSFGKIYAYNIWKLIEEEKKSNKDKISTEEGIWKVWKKGEEKELAKTLEGKGTGWCIAGERVSKDYLSRGNMHIYYTKDKDGNYTMPRVCIREEYGKIAEVRGVEKDQNLEGKMNEITDKKLDEFPDKDEYKKKVNNMKKLTEIYNKNKNNETLSKEELVFLYEIEEDIEGFGWQKDPRIEEILSERNTKKDSKIVFGGPVIKGDLRIKNNHKLLNYITEIKGNADFPELRDVQSFKNLTSVGGSVYCDSLIDAAGFGSLKSIGGDAYFPELRDVQGFKNLTSVGGDVDIGGDAIFDNSEFVTRLGLDDKYYDKLMSDEFKKELDDVLLPDNYYEDNEYDRYVEDRDYYEEDRDYYEEDRDYYENDDYRQR